MILLDTNVVSELMKRHVHPAVAAFIEARPLAEFFVPGIVVAEVLYGIARLPAGRRRERIGTDFAAFMQAGFAARVLPFDAACAAGYAKARTSREQAGRPVQIQDALIGAMALAHGSVLATRNIDDFDGYGLSLVDPWNSA